jgi:hypothetical protein
MVNNYYKCLTDKNGQLRYYKLVSNKWKRISNKVGSKIENNINVKLPKQFLPIKKRYR